MMHTLWNFQLLLVSPSIRSNCDHFLQADFPVPINVDGKTPASLAKLPSYLDFHSECAARKARVSATTRSWNVGSRTSAELRIGRPPSS